MAVTAIFGLFVSLSISSAELADDLTAYWSFDNTRADEAGSIAGSANTVNDNLSLRGSGSGYGAGKFGSAGYSGNGNGYARTGDSADVDPGGNSISISVWMKVGNFNKSWQALVSKGEDNNYRLHRSGSSNNVAFAGGASDISNNISVNDGAWHHIVATASSGDGTRIYIDGALAASNSTAANPANSGNALFIGNNPDRTNRQWNGELDDIAIWHRVITAAEVAEIYNANQSLGDLLSFDPSGDNDGDGLSNGWENDNGLDWESASGDDGAAGDPDDDALINLEEFLNNTDPQNSDTDGDSLLDSSEVQVFSTSPLLSDTDGDGLSDSSELFTYGTNPLLTDTDVDTFSDGLELLFGTSPTNTADQPPTGSSLSGLTSVGTIGPFLDGDLPSKIPNAPSGSNWQTENAFPNLSFADLKGVVSEPRSTFIHVIERRGTLQRVNAATPNTSTKTQVLNIGSLTVNGDNGGLRSVVFHPDFNLAGSPNKDYLYCFYSTTASSSRGFSDGDGDFFYRVARFTRNSSGDFPLSSELVLIQQKSRDRGQHFGGGLAFDAQGHLNISWGDMEFNTTRVGVDFHQDVQRVDRIFQGAVLRIDVDNRGGAISQNPTRTLQGNSGPNALSGSSRSCAPGHPHYHADNFSGLD